MSVERSLRASDADRDAVAQRLSRAAGEGRLEPDELEERLDSALRARTYGELEWLVSDLPGPGGATQRRRRTSLSGLRMLLPVLAVAIAAALFLAGAMLVIALAVTWWTIRAMVCCTRWAIRQGHQHRRLHSRPV